MRKSKTRKKLVFGSALVVLAGFAMLNVAAYNHARAMLHYTSDGTRTRQPEALSFGQKARVLLTGVNLPRPRASHVPADFGLACDAYTIRCARKIQLAAWHIPSADADTLVILFHGYGAEKSSLLREARLLHAMGYGTLLVDFRGSGGSSEALTTIGYLEAEDVVETTAFARARFSYRTLILLGESMGAAAVLRAVACQGVKPDGIILEAVFDTMLNTVRNRFQAMGIPSFPSAELLVFWGGQQHGFNAFSHRPVDYARAVYCPILIMQGANDPRAKPVEARRVYDAAPGSKRWQEFPGAGHESYAAREPDAWQASVREFIDRLTGNARRR